ncbi:unnamed protein product [Mytilus coruscus]|uniref:MAM domain-containing protein n=1 Tax=Mytilus coruscus TaxID=42192 RepID=A0A6J8BZX5_MYTCO|nr:unnamed protein product [Mytilus coruscus]
MISRYCYQYYVRTILHNDPVSVKKGITVLIKGLKEPIIIHSCLTSTSLIEFEATAKYHYGSDLAIDDVALRKASPSSLRTTPSSSPTTVTVASLPIHCNFEDGFCGFQTDNSKFSLVSWSRKSGTESLGNFMFLKGDNTTGTGSYLSLTIDKKTALNGDRANLYIPAIRTRTMTCLTFAYSLPSNTSGSLQVFETDTNTDTATLMRQVSGYHGPHWKSTFVQFLPSADPLVIVIEGSYTGEPGCVVTIDDIHLVEGICDGYVQTTTSTTTTTTWPTTPTLPAMSIKETSSCQSEHVDLLNALSCDFTGDFCSYTLIESPVHWQRKQGKDGNWFLKLPERNNTLSGYYLTLNMSTYHVPHGEGILKTPEINLTSVCVEFWYSIPGATSGIKLEIETSWGHVETIWSKKGKINAGKWNKQALVINCYDKYKASTVSKISFIKPDIHDTKIFYFNLNFAFILFSANKKTSLSYVGIDDIHIYGKSEVTPSSSVTNTAFITNLTSPSTKDVGLITTTTKLGTERSTKQMSIPTTVQQTHISTDLKFTKNKASSTEHPIASSTLQSTLITTSSSVTNTAFITNLTSASTKDTGFITTTTKLGTDRSTKQMPRPTTVQQTHISTDLKFTKNKPSSTDYPFSPSTLQSMLKIKKSSKQTTVQQTHFSTTSTHTEKNTPSTSYSTSSKHVTKKKPTTDTKKITLNKHDSKTTDQSTTPYKIKVTKKTLTTKKNKATKSDANKSEYISKGAQAGIGITVALLGVGLVMAVLFIMKKKISTIDQGDKWNKNEIQMESKYTKTETNINGDTKYVIENGVSHTDNQTAWTSTNPLCKQ